MGVSVLVGDKTGYSDRVIYGQNGVIIKTPMHEQHIDNAFTHLLSLLEKPQWTADQFRAHSRQVDDDVILERLLR